MRPKAVTAFAHWVLQTDSRSPALASFSSKSRTLSVRLSTTSRPGSLVAGAVGSLADVVRKIEDRREAQPLGGALTERCEEVRIFCRWRSIAARVDTSARRLRKIVVLPEARTNPIEQFVHLLTAADLQAERGPDADPSAVAPWQPRRSRVRAPPTSA